KETLDVVAVLLDFQGVPGAHLDLQALLALQLLAIAGHNFVYAVVFLKRVHASNVIIVGVLVAPDDAAPLVVLAPDRLRGNDDLAMLEAGVIHHAEVEDPFRALGRLGQDIAFLGRRGVIGHHFPDTAVLALVGLVGLPTGRNLTDVALGEPEAAGFPLASQ